MTRWPWRHEPAQAPPHEPSEQERQITHGLQSLREASVREVMTPRVDVVALPAPVRLADVVAAVRRSGHSHFPVYRDDPDRLVGVLFLKDLFSMDLFPREGPASAREGTASALGEVAAPALGAGAGAPASLGPPTWARGRETSEAEISHADDAGPAASGLSATDRSSPAPTAPASASSAPPRSAPAVPAASIPAAGVLPAAAVSPTAVGPGPAIVGSGPATAGSGPATAGSGPATAGSTSLGPDLDVTKRVREPYVVPESRSALEVLAEMRRRRRGFAVVVDEYGGFAGVLTVNDLVSELVGDLRDEFDRTSSPAILRIDARRFLVDGACTVSEVREQLGIDIPDGEYVTLGGFLFDVFGRIPEEGDEIEHDGWRLRVTRMDRRRIAKVVVEAPSAKVGTAGSESRRADGK